ncbi:MAG: hypothetical protein IKP29_04515 [Pseudobutyrivibrio sp.]|nr:hypothetical protein [Pseudobutyrivibrio sp.]
MVDFFISLTKSFWNSVGFPMLFVVAIIAIFVFEKEKLKRYTFLWYTCLVFIFIYNPITLLVCKMILEKSTFEQYYLRFFGVAPIMFVIAFGFTLAASKLQGIKKLIAVACLTAVICLAGKCLYTQPWFTKAENRNKVPQDVVTLCDIFADYSEDTIRIMAPQRLAVYLRQMESRFSMPYARSVPDEGLELTALKPDVKSVADYAAENDVDYVVVWAVDETLNAYLNYGFTLFGRTANYAVLQPYQPSWIMTEYDMTSGDQGIFYTVENIADGTFIVIDGGDAQNEQQVRDVIMDHGGVVDAWIITHYHQDHVDAFNAIYPNPKGIDIKQVYVTPLDADVFYSVAQEWDDVDSFNTFINITKDAKNINNVSRNDALQFDDLTITFFNAYDEVVTAGGDIPNNDSLVFKLATANRSALIMGDCHSDFMAEYFIKTYGDKLNADILQLAHHGNNSIPVETGFYDVVSPEVAVFDTPDKIMQSPNYTAGALAAYFIENNVRIIWYNTAPNQFGL